MFKINRVFHLTHVVDDLEAASSWYRDVFAAQPLGHSGGGHTGGGIHLMLIGDIVVMPMTVGPADAPAQRFRQRFGQHLHSIAWFVEDPVDLVRSLLARGVSLRDELGQPLEHLDADDVDHEIWTPPRQAPCLIEFWPVPWESKSGLGDPRFEPGWSPAMWSEHPLGIQRTACLTTVTPDIDSSAAFFTDVLGGTTIADLASTQWGTRSRFVQVGEHTVIELAQPLDATSRAATDLDAHGPILHATTFQVTDLGRAAEHLADKGVGVERPSPNALVIDPDDSAGILLRLTDLPISEW
jgi:catechol 2,3-dioxygenase-like lactoylglutathione lyase family enzyme